MQPYFHALDSTVFCARMGTGAAPTEAERNKFKSPKLKKGILERDLCSEVDTVIQSVLEAAQCKKLCFLNAATSHSGGDRDGSNTFNGTGLYRPLSLMRMANDVESDEGSKEELEKCCLVDRSCFWVDVPIVVNDDENDSLFFFKTKSQGPLAESNLQAAEVDQDGEVAQVSEEDGSDDDDAEEGYEEAKQDNRWHIIDDFSDDIEDIEAVEDDEGPKSKDEDDAPEDKHPSILAISAAGILNTPVPPSIKLSNNSEKALGQFVEYHLNVFKYQHRTFCYSIYVCSNMARLLYFDRAGAYVTEPFSWVEPASPLHEFVWKLAKLANDDDLGNMGYDTTAAVVSPGTRQKFVKEAQNPALAAHIRAGLEKAATSDYPLYELTVEDGPPSPDEWFPDEPIPEPSTGSSRLSLSGSSSDDDSTSEPTDSSTPTIRRFIAGQPHFSANTLVGRCTRGYMAFDVTNPNQWIPCFLKDSWRPLSPRHARPEHLVYERLKRRNVKPTDGIATLVCGGDVGGPRAQCTRVWGDVPAVDRSVCRIHYRLVTADIGLPLSEFENFSELSVIFVDALRAHRKAWDLAGILHRDISVGNIMIRVHGDGKRSGFLIDWDLSRLRCELPEGPVQPVVAGTWQFRSALSLLYPRKPYQRCDDIESFIHVYLYLVLRYHPTNIGNLKNKVAGLFESVSFSNGVEIGGDDKFLMLKSGRLGFQVTGNRYLQELLDDILDNCRRAYSTIDCSEMTRLYDCDEGAQPSVPRKAPGSCKRPSILRPSDDEAPSAEEEEHSDGDDRVRSRTGRRPTSTEPCGKIGPFLENPFWLMKLLAKHAEETYRFDDKAPDQFVARRLQDASSSSGDSRRTTLKRRRCDGESDDSSEDVELDPDIHCRKRAKGRKGLKSPGKRNITT